MSKFRINEMKNFETKLTLIMLPLILVALGAMIGVIFMNLNATIALVLVSTCITGLAFSMYWFKNKGAKLKLRKIFSIENSKTKNIKKVLRFIMFAVFIAYIFFSNKLGLGFGITSVVIILFILLNAFVLQNRVLAIDYNGIHSPFKWNLKWGKIKKYKLDRDTNTLFVEKVDGQTKQVTGIKEEDFEEVENMFKRFYDEKK